MKPLLLGMVDGWEQPWDLSTGRTWPDAEHNECYDRGVNIGQAVRRCIEVLVSRGKVQP